MRLQKYLSEVGFCSRREAEDFIRAGKILINGALASLGDKVTGQEKIVIDGKELEAKVPLPRKVLAFHKPRGVECTLTSFADIKTLLDFDFGPDRVFPVGYLDRESSGLLLLTNDGDLGNRLAQPSRGEESEYVLELKNDISSNIRGKLPQLISAAHKSPYPCKVNDIGGNRFQIRVNNGKAKLIRRACDDAGLEISELIRVRIGKMTLEELEVGTWRILANEELNALK